MSFEVDRLSTSWAHIALCADITWAAEPRDDFVRANQVVKRLSKEYELQRLWAQHCRVSQVLQETTSHNKQANNKETDKRTISNSNPENGGHSGSGRRSVKDVIPESRLAKHYGNFYYDEVREKCYVNAIGRTNGRGYSGQDRDNLDLTECWMLPEVEYWFRKLVEDSAERSALPRRRRSYRMQSDDLINGHRSTVSERWGLTGARAGEEAVLAAKVSSVRRLWASGPPAQPPCTPSPPPVSRKIRARRRQPRKHGDIPLPPPPYCLQAPVQLLCDPAYKFNHLQNTECQRSMGRLSASVQAIVRASASRCPLYRGTNISRYAPTGQRPPRYPDKRYGTWYPQEKTSQRLNHCIQLAQAQHNTESSKTSKIESECKVTSDRKDTPENKDTPDCIPNHKEILEHKDDLKQQNVDQTPLIEEKLVELDSESPENIIIDNQPSTSSVVIETGLKKRLYSTVLSTSAPAPLTQVGCARLAQKIFTPGLIKLNPKIVLTRNRPANVVDNKFEELEKEALEQYKASDESIDTKLRELEKQAVEQYSTSNSNTSCSSGNSAKKQTSNSQPMANDTKTKKQPTKIGKKEKVDSVVIYSQNFPDLNTKSHTNVSSLKNFHTPPRGEKRGQTHRQKRSLKNEQRRASDTDYEAKEAISKANKGPLRWTLHIMSPKKRHLTLRMSDCSSDEEDATSSNKDGPRIKRHVTGKLKMFAHGGGDLHPIIRKT